MTLDVLAQSMAEQARQRVLVLPLYVQNGAFSVAVRESQEVVELSLKAILRLCGIEPPKIHDVGAHLLANADRVARMGDIDVGSLAFASKTLRKDRELSFYGEADFIPTESYSREQAEQAVAWADLAVKAAQTVLRGL